MWLIYEYNLEFILTFAVLQCGIDSNQILHSDRDHQMPFEGGLNTRITNPRWWTSAILEKSKIAISQQLFDRSPRNLASWRSLTLLALTTVKSSKF